MATQNLYWPVYKNLEAETIKISNYIHFSDDQLSVYSMQIANIIIRCAIEVESISKELYKILGGNMNPQNSNGSKRNLYFDTDCMQLLEDQWNICQKEIRVSNINFFFSKPENLILLPLKKANKRSGSKWGRAYQAIKHDRMQSLNYATIGNLLNALGALYILNIYYRDECFNLGKISSVGSFDARLGSDIFSVFVAHAEKISVGTEVSDNDIESSVRNELAHSIYIQKYKEESLRQIHQDVITINQSAIEKLLKSQKVLDFIKDHSNYKIDNIIQLAKDAGGTELVKEITSTVRLAHGFAEACYEVILNKGNQIYPILTEQDVTTK